MPCPAFTPPRTRVLSPRPSCLPLVGSPRSPGRLGLRCSWHRGSSRTLVPVPRIGSSFRTLYGPECCSGAIPPSSPVTQESRAPWISSAGDSGGLPWMRTSVLSLRRALPAPGIRPRLVPVPVCFGLCPFLTDRGHTSPWTSSPACPRPVATPPSSR